MSGASVLANARWELTRLVRSQRVFLLLIPPVAGPVGSAIAFLYFHVPSHATALILGLFVTGGLGALVVLDLSALTVGEELSRKAHFTLFTLPQERWAMLTGRLVVVLGASLGAYSLGAAAVWGMAAALVPPVAGAPAALLDPLHLTGAIAVLLVFLGAVTLTASVITRSSSEALVAGVLAAVVTAAAAGYFLIQGSLTLLLPAVLGGIALISLGWSFMGYAQVES